MDRTTRRSAFITGGSRGIGRAIAERLGRDGWDVAFTFLTNRTAARETAGILESHGARAIPLRGNVADPDQLSRMIGEAGSAFGGLDAFVSNAALGVLKPVRDLTLEDWTRSLDGGARILLQGAREAARLMEGRRGRILAVTSLGSIRVLPNYAAVGAGKAAIEALVRYLAVELGPSGVTVNAISPGVTDTPSLSRFPNREALLADTRARTPLGRAGTPEDVAPVAAFLLSEEAGWITGQTVFVDGGYSLLG
jgi:enoyl-[acyl-carrier protein] reductase III